jgi:hypothetical protein
VLSSSTVRPWSPSAAIFSAGLRPSRRNVASQLTALLTAFITNVRERSRAVSASASGVVSGGSSNVAWAAADAEAVVVELGPCGGAGLSVSVVEESKSADAGCESTSGRYCEKNWCRRRSGALSGGWDASAVGAADGVGRAGEDNPALDGDVVVVPEASSGKDDDVCCWVSLVAVLASTRVVDFAEALAGGTTLGGFDELKKRPPPPGGFENREYDRLEEWCMGRRSLGNIGGGLRGQGREGSALSTGSVDHVMRSAGTRDGMAGADRCAE